MTEPQMKKLRAAASKAARALADMTLTVEEGEIREDGDLAMGYTALALADALRLLIEATDKPRDMGANQLHGALIRFLGE